MSYEIVKTISYKNKTNQLFITSASNNVYPRIYNKWEYMPKETDINEKELNLFYNLIGGVFQMNNSCNKNWLYGFNKFFDYCKINNISMYDLWDLPYKDGNKNINNLREYYDIFKNYRDEKIEGKYFLKSKEGNILKICKNGFNYDLSNSEDRIHYKDYKSIYNDYCKLNNISNNFIKEHDIKIEEYKLEKDTSNEEEIYEL